MINKFFRWLKAPWYKVDSSDEVDWLLIMVMVVILISIVVASYVFMISPKM